MTPGEIREPAEERRLLEMLEEFRARLLREVTDTLQNQSQQPTYREEFVHIQRALDSLDARLPGAAAQGPAWELSVLRVFADRIRAITQDVVGRGYAGTSPPGSVPYVLTDLESDTWVLAASITCSKTTREDGVETICWTPNADHQYWGSGDDTAEARHYLCRGIVRDWEEHLHKIGWSRDGVATAGGHGVLAAHIRHKHVTLPWETL